MPPLGSSVADKATFTAGPWARHDTPDYAEIHPASGKQPSAIALVGRPEDANLIAHAPELFGQLESAQVDLDLLRRAIEEGDPKAELLIRVTDLWKRNDAAIAKARGEA